MGPRWLVSGRAWRVAAALAAWSLGLACGAARAESPREILSSEEALPRADKLYQEGKLSAAAELYRRAERVVRGPERRHCFERLLRIAARMGRQDEAIRIGQDYVAWLGEAEDRPRARAL